MKTMVAAEELRTRISGLSDKDLFKMISTAQDYTPDALAIARDECKQRGGIDVIGPPAQIEVKKEQRQQEEAKETRKARSAVAIAFVPALIITILIVVPLGMALESLLPEKYEGAKWLVSLAVCSVSSLFFFIWNVTATFIGKKMGITDSESEKAK